MTLREEKVRALPSYPPGNLKSPFLDEELFADEPEAEWESRLVALEAESLFRYAFESGRTILSEPDELEEEFVEEGNEAPKKSFLENLDNPEHEERFFEGDASRSEEELLVHEEEKEVFTSEDQEAISAAEPLYTEKEASDTEQEEEPIGLASYGQLAEGPVVPTADDFLLYLEKLVDEEVFDEEAQPAQAEWQAYPTIHVHFAGKSPDERFAKYVEIRPLYQQATGVTNPAQWIAENIITVAFFGHRTPCHRDLKTPLAVSENALRTKAFTPALDSFWGFVPRTMRTRNKLSNHGLGLAIDIDYKTNPHIYNKEDILVIREATGLDLGRRQTHDAMRRASQLFQQTFNQQWRDRQTGQLREAIRKRKEALDTYARVGFLNLELPLIDTLLNAGFTWGGDWQSEKDFMHFELPLARRIEPAAPSAAVRPPSGSGKMLVELVRFAQRVLNAAEGEQLTVDGDLGSLTRGALERFRKKYNLGAGGVLDDTTQLALAQRALEELAQQSMFEKGKYDDATKQALSEFKSQRGLGAEPTLDEATRLALADALERRGALSGKPSVETVVDWAKVHEDQRMRYVMNLLVSQYQYPVNGAAGIVGNLYAESQVIPNRIQGSKIDSPMTAKDWNNKERIFTSVEVMKRNKEDKIGPGEDHPGVGLAQWTKPSRRAGLFNHKQLGAAILYNMDAQVDYLVTELRSTKYSHVDNVLRRSNASLEEASDEFVYNFEEPGTIWGKRGSDGRRPKRLRNHPAVKKEFKSRRAKSQKALQAYTTQQREATA